MIHTIKGAIFDLDGTIIDSMGVWNKIDFDFLNKRNIAMPDDLSAAIKNMNFREAASYFRERFQIPDTVEEIMNEWNDMVFDEYAHNIKLKAGAAKYLSLLKSKKIKVGLATTTCRKPAEAVLRNNGIYRYFDAISTIEEAGKGKDSPGIYLLTAQKLGVRPEECVVFEDILPAVLAAKKAGMKVIGVYDKCSECEQEEICKHADKYIVDFDEMLM